MPDLAAGMASRLASATQGTVATRAVRAHVARPNLHDPSRSAIGTVSAAVVVAPSAKAVVYAEVSRPTRCGKCSLTNEGSKTLAVAMPDRASSDNSRNDAGSFTTLRIRSPVTTHTRDSTMTRCTPSVRAR